jgi:putative oligomerization/nucleic acid binding protein/zinc ribbon protein
MYCTHCGNKLDDDAQFCTSCGKPVGSSVHPAATPAQAGATVSERQGEVELTLQGNQGKTLTVSGDTIRIEKAGFLTGKRHKTILIRNVTSVEVKKPGGFVGFIQFSIAGGKARDSSYTLTGGAFDAVQDENSLIFNGAEKYDIALKIKAYVESWSAPIVPDSPRALSASAADEIKKLKALVDDGIVTPEEFEQRKKQLLGLA